MRLVRFVYGRSIDYGIAQEDEIVPSKEIATRIGKDLPPSLDELISLPLIEKVLELEDRTFAHTIPLEEVKLLKPLTSPPKIICLGKNYAEHAAETGFEPPKEPVIFMKARTSLNGPYDDVIVPDDYVREVDYEGEIAFVMKKGGRRLDEKGAKGSILGYMAFNDVTARDLQRRDGQWVRGKSIDSFAPIGPWIDVSVDFEELGITTWVNGERRQHASSSQMIFKPWDVITILSKGMTLEPGDVIATGTPSGVGGFSNPPRLLKHGDVVEIEIWGVGKIRNRIVYESMRK
ncbi:MAG: fumarylacetoacetate hydrolase family protein [Candidatus Korarchaeota archaeon]|nr:fumarylacetoacetate hydrolase family protein [Candidatus Korarchaeota archaeon]